MDDALVVRVVTVAGPLCVVGVLVPDGVGGGPLQCQRTQKSRLKRIGRIVVEGQLNKKNHQGIPCVLEM